MAFPRDVLRSADLATGHLAEDLHLGLQLASIGRAPFFCPTAVVRSEFPMSAEGAAAQRQRWEQGHLHVILAEAVPYIWTAVRTADWRLLALALDAAVPPITLLGLLIAGLLLGGGLIGLGGHLVASRRKCDRVGPFRRRPHAGVGPMWSRRAAPTKPDLDRSLYRTQACCLRAYALRQGNPKMGED